MLQDTIG